MTSNLKTLSLSLLVSLVAIPTAYSADINRTTAVKAPVKIDDDPIPGVYLRGDIGITNYSVSGGEYRNINTNAINPITGASIERGFNGGVGIGLKKGFMRYDLTVDFRAPRNYGDATPCWTAACGTGVARNSGKIESAVVLGNVYADLGTWYSFTPYVGVGLGLANVTNKDFNGQTYNGPALENQPTSMKSMQNIAFALMAGSAYNINKNLAIDFGYRYLNIGKVESSPAGAGLAEQWMLGRLGAHEMRAGIRYTLD